MCFAECGEGMGDEIPDELVEEQLSGVEDAGDAVTEEGVEVDGDDDEQLVVTSETDEGDTLTYFVAEVTGSSTSEKVTVTGLVDDVPVFTVSFE